ncbi:MAG: hypothetical protein ACTSRG_26635, partial [Candidatus Helarchaeota archaeon]
EDKIMTDMDGFSQFNYTTYLIPNIHNLSARFLGDEFFLPIEKNIPLEIKPEFTQLDYFGTAVPYSDWNLIMVNLTDDEGLPVPFRNVVIRAEFEEGVEIIGVVITNQTGIGVLNYTALQKPGGYLMIATFFSDPYYYSCNNYGILVITKETCSMIMQEIKIMEDVPIIFNMTITEDDGPPVEGAEIGFYIFDTIWENFPPFYSLDPIAMLYPALYEKYSSIGEIVTLEIYLQPLPLPYPFGYWSGQAYVELWIYVGTNSSDDRGVTTLEWEPTVELDEGTYDIKAVYKGSDYYFACNGTAHLSILPKEVYISTIGYWIDRNYYVDITVLDVEGNPVPNFDFTIFIFNGETYSFSVTTDEYGKVSLNLGEPAPGNYTIKFVIVGIEYPTNTSLVIYLSEVSERGLALLIDTWIIISSSIYPEATYSLAVFIGVAGLVGTAVSLIAWVEHLDGWWGIPAAIAAQAIAIAGLTLGFYEFVMVDYSYDQIAFWIWSMIRTIMQERGKIIPVFMEPLGNNELLIALFTIMALDDGLKDASDNSVGLIVLGPRSRANIYAYFINNPTMLNKLRFVYLAYVDSFMDEVILYSGVETVIAVQPINPLNYYITAMWTKQFFLNVGLIDPITADSLLLAIAATQIEFPLLGFAGWTLTVVGVGLGLAAISRIAAGLWIGLMELYFFAWFGMCPAILGWIGI